MAKRKSGGGSGGGFGVFLLGIFCAVLVVVAGGWAYLYFNHRRVAVLPAPSPMSRTRVRPAPSGNGSAMNSSNSSNSSASSSASPSASPSVSPPPVSPPPVSPSAPGNAEPPFEGQPLPVSPRAHAAVNGAPPPPPFGLSEDVFEAGAHIYKQHCASCHGTPGQDAVAALRMNPPSPQLWKKRGNSSVVGVSAAPPGRTFLQTRDGMRGSGMPSYQHILSDDQIWDVSLLLQSAGQELPDPVLTILRRP